MTSLYLFSMEFSWDSLQIVCFVLFFKLCLLFLLTLATVWVPLYGIQEKCVLKKPLLRGMCLQKTVPVFIEGL